MQILTFKQLEEYGIQEPEKLENSNIIKFILGTEKLTRKDIIEQAKKYIKKLKLNSSDNEEVLNLLENVQKEIENLEKREDCTKIEDRYVHWMQRKIIKSHAAELIRVLAGEQIKKNITTN